MLLLDLISKPMKTEAGQAKQTKRDITPEKLIYKLEEVSRIAKLAPKTIESWEREFPFLHAGITAKGDKIFRQKDVDIILRIKELIEKKALTLAGAKRKIEEEFGLKTSAPVHPDRLKKVLFQVRDELQDIASLLRKEAK
jgi:DNA-binding transcriptional MerR regulator